MDFNSEVAFREGQKQKKTNMKRLQLAIMAAALVVTGQAMAAITTYSGQDDGVGAGGPFNNSAAAEASFQSSAGAINTITFEDQSVGFNSSFTAAPGVTVALAGAEYGDGYSGISDNNLYSSPLYGFNITPGGSKWLGLSGDSATFNFATPIDSFGFWDTGVQTYFTSSLTVDFSDGSSQTLNAPINVNGGASYYGFTDPGASISSITINNAGTVNGNDAWGIDDVSYSTSYSAAPVPEPTTIISGALLLLPFGAGVARKLCRKHTA